MNDTKQIVVDSNTVDALVSKVETALSVVADKVGVASDHFYPILVKQQYMEGFIDLGIGAVLLLLSIFLSGVLWLLIRDKDGETVFPVIVITFITILFGISFFGSGLLGVMNPEYYALKEIMEVVK